MCYSKGNNSYFSGLHFKSPLCTKSIETKKWQYRAKHFVLPQIKAYLTSFKKTTNPNVSPIGKRFGFECFGAVVLNGFEKTNLKQPTITHIFIPYPIGTLVFSKIII